MKKTTIYFSVLLMLSIVLFGLSSCYTDLDVWSDSDTIVEAALRDKDKMISKLEKAGYVKESDEDAVSRYINNNQIVKGLLGYPNYAQIDVVLYYVNPNGEDGDFILLYHSSFEGLLDMAYNSLLKREYGDYYATVHYYKEGDNAVGIVGEWAYDASVEALRVIR